MNEKQKIEVATAKGFLDLYNAKLGTSYKFCKLSDSPDAICRDADGQRLGLEITLTEDCPRDIQAALGRSDHRGIANFDLSRPASNLQGNVLESLLQRVREKLQNNYGARTALVVRSTSGVDWDWDTQLPDIRQALAGHQNYFDLGIWLMNRQMNRLFHVLDPHE